MRKPIIAFFLVGMAVLACRESEETPYKPFEQIKSGEETQNDRITYLNEKVTLRVREPIGSTASPNNLTFDSPESSPAFDCDEAIDSAFEGNKRIDNRKVVCLEQDVSFDGILELRGGTFVIKGTANLSAINGNRGKIVITETGSLTIDNINLNNNFELINYGDELTSNALRVSGDFVNHGSISIGALDVNGSGKFENTGSLVVRSNLINNKEVKNKGILEVKSNLVINGGGKLVNECKLLVEGNLTNNKTFENKAYVEVAGTTTVNGGGKIKFEPQAYWYTQELVLNGTLEGHNRQYARVDIASTSTINGGARVTRRLDINDENGFETNRGRFDGTVTINGTLEIAATACNPGPKVTPLNPEYTLVADIVVPELLGDKLSATDVAYHNGVAMVSYHKNGSAFGGAIDVINLSTVNAPGFNMNYISESREFNAISFNGTSVYMAGQRDIETSGYTENNTKGAVLYTTSLNAAGTFNPELDWVETPMPSFSGNSVQAVENGEVLFASGATGGGFYRLSRQGQQIQEALPADNAKFLTMEGNTLVGLVGGVGNAKLIVSRNGSVYEIDLGERANPVDGKNVIVMEDNKAYATLGENGLVVADLIERKVIGRYNPELPGLSNGVAVDNDFIYLANGQSGLLLLRKDNLEFYAQYEYEGSANLVEITDNIILIANGSGGVKLLIRSE